MVGCRSANGNSAIWDDLDGKSPSTPLGPYYAKKIISTGTGQDIVYHSQTVNSVNPWWEWIDGESEESVDWFKIGVQQIYAE